STKHSMPESIPLKPPTPTTTPKRSSAVPSRGAATPSSSRRSSACPPARTPISAAHRAAGSRPPSTTHCAAYKPTTLTSTSCSDRTDTDVEETLSALTDLVHTGKVRARDLDMPASNLVEAH